jgi:hypothetical protein
LLDAGPQREDKRNTYMRKAILGAASALVLASPAVASDLAVTRHSEVPGHEREVRTREVHTREVQTYEHRAARRVVVEHRTAPRVVVQERAPVVSETVVVRRPPGIVERPAVIVERPRVVVEPPPVVVERPRVVIEEEEYPVYAEPPVYAFAGPVWRGRWGHRRHFRGGW